MALHLEEAIDVRATVGAVHGRLADDPFPCEGGPMSSVPDFSQAPAAAAVELVSPPEGEPVTADAPPGSTDLASSAAAAVAPDADPGA